MTITKEANPAELLTAVYSYECRSNQRWQIGACVSDGRPSVQGLISAVIAVDVDLWAGGTLMEVWVICGRFVERRMGVAGNGRVECLSTDRPWIIHAGMPPVHKSISLDDSGQVVSRVNIS